MNSPNTTITPRLGIGLPVYNGERFLTETLDSILAQTFGDFELILSDNASTDATAEICQRFAARDPRVHHHRQGSNVGVAANFNRAFALCRGEYFKWAAADDRLDPTFVQRCVEILDRDPDVVSCFSSMRIVREDGSTHREHFRNALTHTNSPDPAARFAEFALSGHGCFHSWGVMRRSAIAQTPLIGGYVGSDRAFLADLSLRGRIYEIDEDLFHLRDHRARSVKAASFYSRKELFRPGSGSKRAYPHWRLWWEYLRCVRRAPLGAGERLRCTFVALRWPFVRFNAARLAMDVIVAVTPGAEPIQIHAKRAFEGAKRRFRIGFTAG